jgi:hypothetical protein
VDARQSRSSTVVSMWRDIKHFYGNNAPIFFVAFVVVSVTATLVSQRRGSRCTRQAMSRPVGKHGW